MNQRTPQQVAAIKSWTEDRDKLLREIGVLTTDRDERKKEIEEQGLALTDLHTQLAEARGRIAEMKALEDRFKTSLDTDVAQLLARKSRLESECETKEAEIKGLGDKQVVLISSIAGLNAAHDTMKDQAAIVNKVVGDLIEVSTTHLSDAKVLMSDIRTISSEIIEKGNKNVEQTNIVLDKLPRYVFELQKPIPLRRYLPAKRGATIEPEKPE